MDILKFLDYASCKYYEGNPIISDTEFDTLAEMYNYTPVGYQVRDGVEHVTRLYSLKKFYVGETPNPLKKELLTETLKLDGAAVAATYFKGKIMNLLTRGDGITGKDISHLIPGLNIPTEIEKQGLTQIVAEVVAPKNIPNSRNYVAGALGLKSLEEFKTRDLTFVAYGVSPFITKSYEADMLSLGYMGFNNILDPNLDKFPTDGKVLRVDDNESFERLGYTQNAPRGAYALKERKTGVTTTLLDVVWQVGKSGAVSPVAILEPVMIGEAKISRATLHNMAYIDELCLEIGCQVEIVRSGEIIPRIVRRTY